MTNTPAVDKLSITEGSTLRQALELIDSNAQGIVFAVDSAGKLTGVLTDGDIRRILLAGKSLEAAVRDVMGREFVWHYVTAAASEIQASLSDSIRHIPLVDRDRVLVDYACAHRLHNIPVLEPLLAGNELAYVTECINTNWISSQGAFVRKFERMLADYCGMPHALSASNGTTALHLALEALGVGPGDEVIVPDFTFAATINCVLHARATPVIVDVDPVTWNMDPVLLRKAITPRTKAVIPVHLYGQPCDMDEIMRVADEHKLFVVEDCAEALGSSIGGRKVGTFGHVAAFSFFGNKTITTGEGGMLLFRDAEVHARAAMLRDHGMQPGRRYWHERVGYNYRMTNLQAAIGVAQMEKVTEFVSRKSRIGELYAKGLAGAGGITTPAAVPGNFNSFWLYTVLLPEGAAEGREEIMRKLLANGIETRPAFFPLHVMPPYREFAPAGGCPVSKAISARGLSLPSAVTVKDQEIARIGAKLLSLLEVKTMLRERE